MANLENKIPRVCYDNNGEITLFGSDSISIFVVDIYIYIFPISINPDIMIPYVSDQPRNNPTLLSKDICACCVTLELFQNGAFSVDVMTQVADQGWGLLSQFSPSRYFPNFSTFFKTHVRYWIARLYLTGIATAQLRWYLSNMKVIKRI